MEVEVLVEAVESVVVSHVAEMVAEVLEEVVVEHQFKMEMVPLLVGFLLTKLLPYHQQLC